MVPSSAVRLRVAIATWILLVAVVAEPVVRADNKKPGTPWSQGVSEAAQKRALQLFEEGNVFFEQSKYTEAIAKYEQALAAWDHPNIRFNIAICLINMRQPLVAWDHLKQALRFGDAPLGKRHHAEAITYVAVLESSLAELTVKSTQPDVNVMVDGGQALTGSGEHTMKLLAGKHQLVATRPGYVTDSRALDLPAGQAVTEQIALLPEQVKVERENYERRWQWWMPWAVAGSSVVLGLVGSGVYLSASSEIKHYDQDLAQLCPAGCTDAQIPGSLRSRATSARHKSEVAIALWSGAGALVITGGVMAILNRPRKQEERRITPALTVSRDYVGVGISLALH
jgi:tetratricopeptide (TPR) repeat protein